MIRSLYYFFNFSIACFLYYLFVNVAIVNMSSTNETFLYFAYGSNLLKQRLHINNPTAVRVTFAKLKGYRLDFAGFARRWGGAVATIEPDENSEMWGAVWKVDASNLASLDQQEGVHDGVYSPLNVTVMSDKGDNYECRTYKYNTKEALPIYKDYSNLPQIRRPSPLYLQTILRGSIESQLPKDYNKLLLTIPHNDHESSVPLEEFLSHSNALLNKPE